MKNHAHDALFDVQVLKRLVIENLELESIIQNCVTCDEIERRLENKKRIKKKCSTSKTIKKRYLTRYVGEISSV